MSGLTHSLFGRFLAVGIAAALAFLGCVPTPPLTPNMGWKSGMGRPTRRRRTGMKPVPCGPRTSA